MTEGAEIPAATSLTEIEVRGENACSAVQLQGGVLHVDVEDTVWKFVEETYGIDHLPEKMTWVEIEAESLAIADCLQGAFGGNNVEGYFRGMDLKCEFYAAFIKYIEDWVPHFGEVFKAIVNHFIAYGGETVKKVPYR